MIPAIVMLGVYWQGMTAWFQQDDFAWLSLLAGVREGEPLWKALFQPSQHGTWRPLSERAYFLLFPWLFGYEAWPMRAVCFATQLASLALAGAITHQLTGSTLAAVAAPLIWIANSKMVIAMVSNGAYVHVLGGFFLLLAVWFLLTGRWKGMWMAFLTGFLASETNLVFPALASAYSLFLRRDLLSRTLWLWPVSIAYAILHLAFIPKMSSGAYALQLSPQMLWTLGRYWIWIFEPDNLPAFSFIPPLLARAFAVSISLLLAVYIIWQTRLKQFLPLLFLVWFVVLISPVLPLQREPAGYYLTIPLAAFGMLAASPLAVRKVLPWGLAGTMLYLGLMIPVAYGATRWWTERSHVAERLVKRVFAVHQLHPEKTIVLENVTDEQFWAAIAHYPFLRGGKTYVFLDPRSRSHIEPHPESGVILDEFFPERIEGPLLRLDARDR